MAAYRNIPITTEKVLDELGKKREN